MDNEQEKVDSTNNNEEVLESEAEEKEEGDAPEGDKPEKKEYSTEEKLARVERMRKKYMKELGISEEKPKTSEKSDKGSKSKELGYSEKAFLIASGVKGSDEIKLAQEFIENTGKTLDEIVENKFFQAELKELRDSKITAEAIPKGTKRSGSSSKDSVDYWLAKGELPPNTPENVELRRKVVNAKYAQETSGGKFGSPTGSVMRQSQLKK